MKVLYGRSSHHQIEAVFKAFARALRVACAKDRRLARMLPSTKGLLVIALIDYKAGNLTSVRKALRRDRRRRRSRRDRPAISRRRAASSCRASDTSAPPRALDARVDRRQSSRRVGEGRPLLGICLGMQWLFEGSDEAPDLPGLGLLAGHVRQAATISGGALEDPARRLEQPRPGTQTRLAATASRPARRCTSRTASWRRSPATRRSPRRHGEPFAAIVQRGHIVGVQFHPEKSGTSACGSSATSSSTDRLTGVFHAV